MEKFFDFDKIATLLARKDFKVTFDALHGISGPYVLDILNKIFKVPLDTLHNCEVLEDFGGHHPDPNLVYAKELADSLDVFLTLKDTDNLPDFGAACDGDADRNMILGKQFFVGPSDSLALITANSSMIPGLGSLSGVARSMPTSGAVDNVAKALNIPVYETPTGWKFFGNLLDAGKISLCGEESFGTGSFHAREKDGFWAVLCWLQILAAYNEKTEIGKLCSVRDIVLAHWKKYGRNYYCRHDYDGVSSDQAKEIMKVVEANFEQFESDYPGGKATIFNYQDPVDGSWSKNQGWIFTYPDSSRLIFRLSGTSSTGATIRIYYEKYVDSKGELEGDLHKIIEDLVKDSLKYSKVFEISGFKGPTVIT
jgi:phosphoglucomutase